jgi:alpha-L-arabinofuranosidase
VPTDASLPTGERSFRFTIDPDAHRGAIDRRLFGSFVEHMGRCVYTGIFEPDHPTAAPDGFRGDVEDLVRELGITVVRYPGGNFVSGYRWQDGIGPRENRPRRLDLAWRSIETNQVGTDEFLRWAKRLDIEAMLAVNLGTAGILEAADLVEYCNVPGGTRWSDERRANGSPDPYGVKLWCLGNEMDGPWQTGHKNAAEYGALALQAANAMRLVDPTIELVACGSSGHDIPTFGYWESTVLEHTFDVVDYVSMHAYYQQHDDDRHSFLASGAAMDRFIDDVVATADAVAARKHSRKRLKISFDEWNVWYQSRFVGPAATEIDVSGPRIEDIYSATDAVVVGDLLISLINHADRIGVACLAQLVNVIAPIMTEPGGPAWRQSTFFPIAETIRRAAGNSLVVTGDAGEMPTARYGDVPVVAVAATHDPDTSAISVFITNRGDEPATVQLRHPGLGEWHEVDALSVVADDRGPLAGAEAAASARPTRQAKAVTEQGTTALTVPPASWTVVTTGANGRAD